jgi:hypothetical protein
MIKSSRSVRHLCITFVPDLGVVCSEEVGVGPGVAGAFKFLGTSSGGRGATSGDTLPFERFSTVSSRFILLNYPVLVQSE